MLKFIYTFYDSSYAHIVGVLFVHKKICIMQLCAVLSMFFNPCLLVVCNILILIDTLFVCCISYRATSIKIPTIIVNLAITSGSIQFISVQSSHSVMSDFLRPHGLKASVYHQLPELAQTHVHRVGDAIPPSHLLSSPFPAFNLSQHQDLFQ